MARHKLGEEDGSGHESLARWWGIMVGVPGRWHCSAARLCLRDGLLPEGWTSATVARHYLTCQRQKGPSEKAKMICFGPVSNLWNGAQLPTVSELFWGRNLVLKKSTFSVLLAPSFRPPQTLRPTTFLPPKWGVPGPRWPSLALLPKKL